ncbi:TIGR02611 family protein [Planosporangium flavigriseum]|uniref:PGPGW domain-containing protein n=1 Tax=Planosporangium flavigriseum TaxID=373681 RepID=UPI00143B9672|nr:PGPGW domain-containing protein [Planosporangium flavigriseum]NJC66246.1 TIGR02611 family protein [Planosporangium flavigriseum]
MPGGPALFRLLVGLTGLVVVAVGLALVPLPGPGWVIVLGGVAIWAIEFMWARHLLRYTTEQLYRWNVWQRGQHWLVRVFLLLAVLAITATVVWLSIKQTFGFDVIDYVLGVGWAG